MKPVSRAFLLVAFLCGLYRAAMSDDKCYICHASLGDSPSKKFERDIHFRKGISCAGCHGGNSKSDDMEVGMSKAAGFIGIPRGDAVSAACARCHSSASEMKTYGSSLPTDQWEELQKSVHTKISLTGKEHIIQCTTCHEAHGIVSARNPTSPVYPLNVPRTCSRCHSNATYMRAYNPAMPVDQLEKYKTSVHGIRLSKGDARAAECVSCHGSHGIRSASDTRSAVYPTNVPATCATCHSNEEYMAGYGIATDQFLKFKRSVHGIALLEKKDLGSPACNDCHGNHGATPPGVQSISMVCGTCHAINSELFARSPHKKAFDEKRLPECETCHGNHEILSATDELIGITEKAVCTRCHSESRNPKGFIAARVIRSKIDSLAMREDRAKALLEEAEQKGMEVTDAAFKLRSVRQARLESRTMIHAFDVGKVDEIIQRGSALAMEAAAEGQGALDEYSFRRLGLGISTLIITSLVITLALYLKRIEKKQFRESGSSRS